MLFLTSTSNGAAHRAMLANQQYFGRFYSPVDSFRSGDLGLWENWILDNGAFTGYDQAKFFRFLEGLQLFSELCRMVIVPDVPFHWKETWEKYQCWHQTIANLGFRRGLAVQDGATVENIQWDIVDGIFIGGSTEWKRGEQFNNLPLFRETAIHSRDQIIREAKRRGLWVHIGRQANSIKQLWNAYYMGADSVDGTGETNAPNQAIIWISQTMWDIHQIKEGRSGYSLLNSGDPGESSGGAIRGRSHYSKRLLAYSVRPDR